MRIAVLTTSYPREPGDPAGHFVQTEARALSEAGHEVWVIAPGRETRTLSGSPNLAWLASGSAFGWPGVAARLRERPARTLDVLRYLVAARRTLRERGPFDRVVAHWLVPCGVPLAISASGGAELEFVAHGSDVRLLARAPALARPLLRALLARDVTLRCVSRELADMLVRLEPRTAAAVRVEPCALDLPSTLDRNSARAELELDDTALLVVVARLVGDKRVEAALSSARLLPFARCVVIGDGPRRAALERQFPGVEFLGTVPRDLCLRWIAAADLVLSTSTLEGAPSVVREARALGTAVVACAAGDLDSWSENDQRLYVLTGERCLR